MPALETEELLRGSRSGVLMRRNGFRTRGHWYIPSPFTYLIWTALFAAGALLTRGLCAWGTPSGIRQMWHCTYRTEHFVLHSDRFMTFMQQSMATLTLLFFPNNLTKTAALWPTKDTYGRRQWLPLYCWLCFFGAIVLWPPLCIHHLEHWVPELTIAALMLLSSYAIYLEYVYQYYYARQHAAELTQTLRPPPTFTLHGNGWMALVATLVVTLGLMGSAILAGVIWPDTPRQFGSYVSLLLVGSLFRASDHVHYFEASTAFVKACARAAPYLNRLCLFTLYGMICKGMAALGPDIMLA